MVIRMVACGIFGPELEYILKQLKEEGALADEIAVSYVEPALHVDYDKLKVGITEALDKVEEPARVLLFGSMCHPDLRAFTEKYRVIRPVPGNCVEMIFGKERQREAEKDARVFYLTLGWLKHWREIFVEGQGWDEIDARQSFGFYDKILLLDTGIMEINEDDLLEFFEYTQVPIEIEAIDLAEFKGHIVQSIAEALPEPLFTKNL